MKNYLKSSIILMLFTSVSLLFWNCQTENEVLENDTPSLLEKLQSNFNAENFKKAIPYGFDVNWNNSLKEFSKELETTYYEFPIIYTSKFNPDEIQKGKSQKRKYNISYKLLVTESEEQEYKYYILKFYQEKSKNSSFLGNSFVGKSNFTGFTHLLDNNGQIVFAKKFEKGIEDNKKFYNKEFKEKRDKEENLYARVDETCTTVATYQYTDNYVRWGSGPAIYVSTTFNGSFTTTSCESYWIPDLNTGGGGGSGLYKNNGDAGIYNNCVGIECKYKIDDAEEVLSINDFVVEAPGDPISLNQYLNCFSNPSQNATFSLTIYVDQPIPNQDDTWTNDGTIIDPDINVGHTFISLNMNESGTTTTQTFGFYPFTGVNPSSPQTTGAWIDDGSHHYDVSATITLNTTQFNNLTTTIQNFGTPTYNLNSMNCSDAAIQICNTMGMSLSDTSGSWFGGGGSNPGNLGQDIRSMSNTNMSLNNIGGNAPLSKGNNCN